MDARWTLWCALALSLGNLGCHHTRPSKEDLPCLACIRPGQVGSLCNSIQHDKTAPYITHDDAVAAMLQSELHPEDGPPKESEPQTPEK